MTQHTSLLDKLVSDLVIAGFALSGPGPSPARYVGSHRAGHSVQVLEVAITWDSLCGLWH